MRESLPGRVREVRVKRKTAAFFGLALTLAAALYFSPGDNFHAVIPGQVYRSAQLSEASLEGYARDRKFEAVLNLRGASPDEQWYRAEKALTARLGIEQFDIGLRAYELPGIVKLEKLLDRMIKK